MISLHKYYNFAALLPLGITAFSGLVLSLTHDGSKYKSEWSADDGFVLTVFLTILVSVFITLLSLTIYLNKKPVIRNNVFFSFLSWTTAAGLLCVFIIYQEWLNFYGHSDIDDIYHGNKLLDGFIMATALLHLSGLIITYLHFIKNRNIR